MPSLNTKMHVEPIKQFEMIKNINLFLTAAKEVFRIRDSFLFTAEELYYCQDVHKVRVSVLDSGLPGSLLKFRLVTLAYLQVMLCLSELSKNPRSLTHGHE